MKVIIIAAGYAKRLDQNIKAKPKGLLDINGKSILERQISLFRKNGINDIFIITGPYRNFGIDHVTYIHDEFYDKHDVLGSMLASRDVLNGDVITSYSDILFDESILHQLITFNGDIGIPIDFDWETMYSGRIQHPKIEADNVLVSSNKILKIHKGMSINSNSDRIGEFLGLIRFSSVGSKIFIDHYKNLELTHEGKFHKSPSLEKAYLTDMLQELINREIIINPISISGKWCEVDTLEDLAIARKLFID